MKVGTATVKTAKKGVRAYGRFQVVKVAGKRGAKLLVIPIAAGGGLVAYKKLTSSSSDDTTATPYGSPVGPVATPATVTPPKAAAGRGPQRRGRHHEHQHPGDRVRLGLLNPTTVRGKAARYRSPPPFVVLEERRGGEPS